MLEHNDLPVYIGALCAAEVPRWRQLYVGADRVALCSGLRQRRSSVL